MSPFRCLNISTSQYSAQGRGRHWRAIAEIKAVRKKNKIDWHIEMQCRESSKDVRKLWLVICCHFIIFYLSLRFVLIHPRVHLWGGQMREAFSANLERWSFAWFRLWAPGKLRAFFLLRAKSTTSYIHTRTWTDCSILTYVHYTEKHV
jgi:hypothetical protein